MAEVPRLITQRNIVSYGGAFVAGAIGQVSAEGIKIIEGSDLAKFPEGWNSLNIPEEILEGGLSCVGGALSAKILYYILCRSEKTKYSAADETRFIHAGAILGYIAMAAFIGPIIHELTGVSDVKWGPF